MVRFTSDEATFVVDSYVLKRDEDFDDSYESLIMLGSMLGEAVPKATPSEVISGLKTGLYKEWQTTDGDKRCPICLDDYGLTDTVTKLNDCPHWLHKECLEVRFVFCVLRQDSHQAVAMAEECEYLSGLSESCEGRLYVQYECSASTTK
ncbi:hypothetical protein BDZ89DRAFT_942516 [Hymenopellis radicata]|nr:hypothetical protein BDZ89DRAFT_942516 [Hymenopellis radicata]